MRENINKHYYYIINILFFLIPISMMIGSFIVNLNILFITLFGLFFFKKYILDFKPNYIDKIVIFFFIYIFFTFTFNYFENYLNDIKTSKIIINKTFLYFRFLFFFLILRVLFKEKILNIKFFNNICAICAFFICIDIFLQFFFNKNVFGMIPVSRKYMSSVFGDELIAGSYLQKFSIFFLFIPLFFKRNNNKKNLILLISIIIIAIAIALSGNRMPLILFLFSIFIYFYFLELKKKIILLFVILTIVFTLIFSFNKNFKSHALNFYNSAITIVQSFTIKNMNEMPLEYWHKPYITEFHCGLEIIKINPYFGGGIRFYRTVSGGCNSHPHNYYLEIISDLGFFGLIIFLVIFSFLFKEIIFNKIKKKSFNYKYWPFFLIIFIEVFPLKTSGSIFTSKNSLIIFLCLAVLATLVSNHETKKI